MAAEAGSSDQSVLLESLEEGVLTLTLNRNYYEAVLPKLSDNGLIVADNALRDGRVLEDGDEPMKEFNDHVRNDSRVECVLLTVRDGMLLVRKK